MSLILTLTEADFDQTVLQAPGVVAVHFWAPWNGPCRTIAPVLQELADEFADRLVFAKVSIDEELNLTARFNAGAIPLLLFFKGGQEIERMQGTAPKYALKLKIEEVLAR